MEKNKLTDKVLSLINKFEQIITFLVSIIIGIIIIIAFLRICSTFYTIFFNDFFSPQDISFEDYQQIFGKIMTLLISLEFMISITKVLKTHQIKTLVLDVVLITALAIARKLIIFDYEHHDPISTLVLGGILLCMGIFYFLIKYERR